MNSEEVQIIYEDEFILAVNKPAGLVVHSDGRTDEKTLSDWVIENRKDMVSVGEPFTLPNGETIERPGVVHRIDRDTSGVIVLAKTDDSFEFLKQQFQNRTVEKKYNAFVYGKLKERSGIIDFPIGRSTSDFRLWVAGKNVRGVTREALTRYEVLKENEEASFLEVIPKTGRTHQIRVHMKAINHPVVCDARYAPKQLCILGFTRLALHARQISIIVPSGVGMTLEAPFPDDFLQALTELEA